MTLNTKDYSSLTDGQLYHLKVPNSADQFTLMRRLYQLSSYAYKDTTVIAKHNEIQRYHSYYNENRRALRGLCKSFDKYLMFVLRWRCRGLSCEQAILKSTHEANKRTTFMSTSTYKKRTNTSKKSC